jgi:hypothetical protein
MATRWSRKLGELYLRPKGLYGKVGDVEELAVLRRCGFCGVDWLALLWLPLRSVEKNREGEVE